MNIYVYAMKMEKEGENYYRELAEKVNNAGLNKILTFLAEQEVKHYNVLLEMSKENPTPTMAEEPFLTDVKTIFGEMKDNLNVDEFESSEISFYKKAKEVEKASYDFYKEKADQTMLESHKDIFLKIAKEEMNHIKVMESLIEFTNAPAQWIEDAEWSKLGEEY